MKAAFNGNYQEENHVDDIKIIELYWERKEDAIKETSLKYGGLCTHIARNILSSYKDSEECVNDTYFALWNAIPSQKPSIFSAFIGRITRNLALKNMSTFLRQNEILLQLQLLRNWAIVYRERIMLNLKSKADKSKT